MRPPTDTIVAVATPAGRGAVGMVRLSGPDTPRIAEALLGTVPQPRRATLRRFRDADGDSIDEGIACYFPAPASFTGEDVLELQGHGGPVILDRLVLRTLALGARMARPGEFTERAFLNGKIDLTQAEAVADLIDAGTAAAARAAMRSLRGDFSVRIQELQRRLTELRTYVEAAIDFPDEEIDFLAGGAVRERLDRLLAEFDSIAAAARQGALLREGLTVVIAGRPNAGKSSLMNRLAGEDIAIVTPLPGTTRDVLRQSVEWDGLPVTLVDTAGLRTAADVIEEEGIRRAQAEIGRADHVLLVCDATAPAAEGMELDLGRFQAPMTRVSNKIDLLGLDPREDISDGTSRVFISARSGAGLDLLRAHIKTVAGFQDAGSGALSARRRHLDALARARDMVTHAAGEPGGSQSAELFAEDLRLAQRHLGAITGEFTSDDLLGQIFASFCIGK